MIHSSNHTSRPAPCMIELMEGMHAVKSLYLSSDSQSKNKVKQIEKENEKIEVQKERGESS